MNDSRAELHYFEQRAEQELRRAELADRPEAARAHALLAGYYLDLVHNGGAAEIALAVPRGMHIDELDPSPAGADRQRQARACPYQATRSEEERHHARRR